jgi:NADPH-dependent 2,4-dienoyl-CoA reductase/sulfur reductase-like enzyme
VAERLVVIGGDAGGMTAATNARRKDPTLDIVALERGAWTSYSACGIPYLVGGEVDAVEDLVARTPEELRNDSRIDVRIHHEVTAIDLDRRSVEVRDLARQRSFHLDFDLLHIATGARPTRPPLPGIDLDHVRGVQTLDDGKALLDRARTSTCDEVVVVGGGYIGLEMAEAFVRWGAKVTVVESADQLMSTLDHDMAERLLAPMAGLGITVRLDTKVAAFEPGRVLLEGADPLPADLVVLGLGVTPNGELAHEAGVELGVRGAIAVDRRQRTSAEGVYAAGDCATSMHRVSGRPVHVALGTVANKQGRVAGINLGGGYATFPGVVGTAATRVCSVEVARTGLTGREVAAAGFDAVWATIESTTHAGYLPDAAPISVKLAAERATGRLLGAQIVGGAGSGKRIDVVATALHAEMTVHDLIDLDLAYVPPLSSVWDPIAVAARAVAAKL